MSQIIVLDGTKMNSKEEFHAELIKKFQLPEYYGKNRDALWDLLSTDLPTPSKIRWIKYSTAKKNFSETIDYLELLLDLAKELHFEVELA